MDSDVKDVIKDKTKNYEKYLDRIEELIIVGGPRLSLAFGLRF
jgi:hypothetical protein